VTENLFGTNTQLTKSQSTEFQPSNRNDLITDKSKNGNLAVIRDSVTWALVTGDLVTEAFLADFIRAFSI
jgi:hypothetical protein